MNDVRIIQQNTVKHSSSCIPNLALSFVLEGISTQRMGIAVGAVILTEPKSSAFQGHQADLTAQER